MSDVDNSIDPLTSLREKGESGQPVTTLPDDVLKEVGDTMTKAFIAAEIEEYASSQMVVSQFRAWEKAYELGKRDHAR